MTALAWYPWLKALHIAFMVTWFAGLFYLPRLFIYHAEARDAVSLQRFIVMERRLYAIMSLGAAVTVVLGVALMTINHGVLSQGWFHTKIVLLVGLFVYHGRCRRWIDRLARGELPDDTRWLRWFNEIPVLFLLGIIGLAVVKPF